MQVIDVPDTRVNFTVSLLNRTGTTYLHNDDINVAVVVDGPPYHYKCKVHTPMKVDFVLIQMFLRR